MFGADLDCGLDLILLESDFNFNFNLVFILALHNPYFARMISMTAVINIAVPINVNNVTLRFADKLDEFWRVSISVDIDDEFVENNDTLFAGFVVIVINVLTLDISDSNVNVGVCVD